MNENEYLRKIIKGYNSIFNIENSNIPFTTKVVDDMFLERLNLSNSKEERIGIEKIKAELRRQNALVVSPDEKDKNFYILISNKRFNEQFDFIKSICHEYTHVIDLDNYMKLYSLTSLRKNPNIADYKSYMVLTEFQARYRSFIIYNLILGYSKEKADIYESYRALCCEYYNQINTEIYNRDYTKPLYYLAQFLGQYQSLNVYFELQLPLPQFIYDLRLESLSNKIIEVIQAKSLFCKTDEIMSEIKKRFK